jgi:N12 class adenine-specific DNA methylase
VGDADDARDPRGRRRRGDRRLAFRPRTQDDLAPSGARRRVQANLAALELLRTLQADERQATAGEQHVLARWSSWGAVPEIFDEARTEWAPERERLHALLDDRAYAAARRTTINAHYTDPAYVQAIWTALGDLGFDGGVVLEPGAGAGTFIGMAPDSAEMIGVELDPTSAAIAAALYPNATIRKESFADTPYRAGHFDATIGNVPFADVRLHDPRHNRGGHSLHNHCIIKSLALTRPGGIVAVLTSRYTLDAQNPAARREINALADVVGAVRLPTGAHQRGAGTQVITDLLILRRREADTAPASTIWEHSRALGLDDSGDLRVNAYFDEHPDHVLGAYAVSTGQYGAPALQVRALTNADVGGDLARALADITTGAQNAGLTMTTRPTGTVLAQRAALAPATGLWDGHLTAQPDGSFTRVLDGEHAPADVPASQRVELQALLGLRDTAKALLTAEAASVEDTDETDRLRAQLRDRYSAYTARYGPINRFSTRATGHTDPATGERRLARVVPRVMHTLRSDPFAPLVMALESFDETTQTAIPATMLSQRTLVARMPVLGVDNPDDALAVCVEAHGRVDLEEIAALLGATAQEARDVLGELVYDDPGSGELVPAAEYLSGNVRDKLDVAIAAARPELEVNVAALREVIPEDLGMDDVQGRLGAAWIDADTHQEFLREILDDPTLVVEHPGAAMWGVRGVNRSVAANNEWGTDRMAAPAIAKAVLEQRPVQVTDEVEPGRRVVNAGETAAAVEKAEAMQERFGDWIWEDPDRGTRLLAEYNRRFNALVLRDYTAEGERLTLPGLAHAFAPRPHQRAAVARMLNEPAVGLFHQVGAGKTAEMVMGCMELRRLGMVNKPAVVVPNHMLEQFAREWLQLYPQTRLLAASSDDLADDKRRAFVARVATNDWDAVLMTRSAFERLPVSADTAAAYVERECEALRAMLDRAQGSHGLTVKRIEKQLLRAEAALEKRLDGPTDPGISFEESGIDYLTVDEFHAYKNLRTASNIRDAAIDGSNRASDMHMKIEYLRNRHGARVITAATATPIANSVTEAHVMQRYLRPDLLAEAGVLDFDAWAATFGQTVTEIEMAPSGGGNYRMQTRFAKFQNVPEMLRLWHVFADVKTAEDLNLPTPALWPRPDGERLPQTVVVEASPEIAAYVADLGERAEAVRAKRVTPEEDNMLKISTDGRKAALDMRMVTGQASSTPSKLDVAAVKIASIWRENRANVYRDPASGEVSPRLGALQIVFCDLGTPRETWNAYDELRDQLSARGVPRDEIRFVHDARNDAEKGRLFAAARAGQVAVLIGSTEKMGVGLNVQARAIALHHIDCPWRPADIEQRDGRILRQGNQNPEVGNYRYAVEGSFDAYSWQTVERKARFIAQIMRGRLDVREIDDIGDSALSFAEVKALASGDLLILDKAAADAERTRLERLQRAYQRNQHALARTSASAEARFGRTARELAAIQAAIAQRVDTRGDAFRMRVGDRRAIERPQAADLIRDWIATNARGGIPYGRPQHPLGELGELGGFAVDAALTRTLTATPNVELSLRGVPAQPATLGLDTVRQDALSLVRQLERRIHDLPALADRVEAAGVAAAEETARAQHGLAQPFKHTDALKAATARSREIAIEMQNRQKAQPEAATDSDTADPSVVAAAEADRIARASFPTPVQGAPRGTAATPARRPPAPGRDNDVSR